MNLFSSLTEPPVNEGVRWVDSSLLRLSSIASVSKLTVDCTDAEATDAFTCLVFIKGGFRDWGIANARLSAPRGGDGGG